MKRLIKLILALSMIVTLIPKGIVSALDTDELIEQELEVAVISGDGSAENPYEVDYSKAPHFKEYMDSINESVMNTLNGSLLNGNMGARGIYDGILTGQSYSNQTNGGKWSYSYGAPSVAYNGNIWMKKIIYVTPAMVVSIRNLKANDMLFGILEGNIEDIVNQPYDDAVELLIREGLEEAMAESVLKALGKYNNFLTAIEIMKFVSDLFELAKYNRAVANQDGMINATYNTSYNGSWYAQYGEDSWTTPPTVYIPGSAYGTGTYSSGL